MIVLPSTVCRCGHARYQHNQLVTPAGACYGVEHSAFTGAVFCECAEFLEALEESA